MNRKQWLTRSFSLLLSGVLTLGCLPPVRAVEVQQPDAARLVSATSYTLVQGVTESDVLLNNEDGTAQVAGFMTTVEPGAQAAFKASYSGYYTKGSTPESRRESAAGLKWEMSATSDQAAAYEAATGENVIFATNGDYYNMQTGQPLGYLIMEGNTVQLSNSGVAYEPYFAVLKDGTCEVREAGTDHSDVLEAISGPVWLLKDGQIVTNDTSGLAPRNSIGVKADGTVVTFMSDGRQSPYSEGQTLVDVAEFLQAQGVVDAIYLDGGGSATYVSQREGEADLTVRNSPSDGEERLVASALMLVYTGEEPTGDFDHAALTPNHEQYTPGSTVQFAAAGVDTAGRQAVLPDDLTWSLENEETGEIDDSGRFTAAEGYTGPVTVNLSQGDRQVGSTAIYIAEPDQISFTSQTASLDFGESSGLGLSVRRGFRDIHYKDGDLQWSVSSSTPDVDDSEIGSFQGNRFIAGTAEGTLNGVVTVSYTPMDGGEPLTASIRVEIGKMPVVLLDFEADEDGNLPTCANFNWGGGYNQMMDTEYTGSVPNVTVVTGGQYSGSPTTAVVSAPFKFTGNYETPVPAADIFRANGYSYYVWANAALDAVDSCDLKVTSDAARFGSSALELDYDYSSYNGNKNANFYMRYCGEDNLIIDGAPTELGVWIYAPEGTSGVIPYIQVEAWDGSTYVTKFFALEPQTKAEGDAKGISWTGWMYCKADCSSLKSFASEEHPLRIQPGQGFLWLSYQPGTGANRTQGYLYFDNFRAVYGTNTDDLVNPVIGETTINGVTLADDGSTVLTNGSVEFLTQYDDPESENRSGIDAEATIIKIDGERKNADKSATETRTTAGLNNGTHTYSITVFDAFGNSATKSYSFTVNNQAINTPKVILEGADTVVMGNSYTLTLKADGDISAVDAVLTQLNSDFGEPEVRFAEGVQGTSAYTQTGFKKASLTIEAAGEVTGTICTITFSVPSDLDPELDFFTCDPATITYTGTDANRTGYACAQAAMKLPLSAYYTLDAGVLIQGAPCTIRVFGPDGQPAAGVEIYNGETSLGTTGEDGALTTDALKDLAAGTKCSFTARKGNNVSFATEYTIMAQAGSEDGKPGSIRFAAGTDNRTKQTITWMAKAGAENSAAVVRYMTKADYDAKAGFDFAEISDAYVQTEGQSTLTAFSVSKSAALVNRVELTGLQPGTTYCCVVGDGTNWSEVHTFTTAPDSQSTTDFLIVGDTQMSGNPASDSDAIAILDQIGESVKGKHFDFGLQTGDFVDNGADYNQWQEILDLFDQNFGGLDFVTVLGNHEYYGDTSAANARSILATPGQDYYSVEYGDVYLAVINNGADLTQALDWLVKDAAQSDCEWKLLSVHQPAYYTNPNGGSDRYHALLPAAAEKAGIDAVFSGHDHSYARTEAMAGGKVSSSGVTYFICGDLGEKSRSDSYKIVNNPDFHFAKTSQEYDGIYLTGNAEGKKLTISAYNSDGTQVDTVTLRHESGSSGSGSSSSSGGSYAITIPDKTDHGSVSVSPRSARHGDTVTITVRPDSGYVLEQVTARDSRGNLLPLTDRGDGKYTFTMPAGKVDVAASFMEDNSVLSFFVDVPNSAYYYETVKWAVEHGITSGTDTLHFSPDAPCTRAQIVTFLWRAAGSPEPKGASSFSDVSADAYYAKAVAWAVENGITGGTSANTFSPDAPCTREQAVTFLYRASGSPAVTGGSAFDDVADGDYYAKAVTWAEKNGVTGGIGGGLFGSGSPCTRAQIVTFLYQAYSGK